MMNSSKMAALHKSSHGSSLASFERFLDIVLSYDLILLLSVREMSKLAYPSGGDIKV